MKHSIMLILSLLQLSCSSQSPHNYIWCNNIKISLGSSEKKLTICSLNERILVETFGEPKTVEKQEMPYNSAKYYYGSDSFVMAGSDGAGGDSFRFKTSNFCLVVQDSIMIRVGDDIEKIFSWFPKSAANASETKYGVKSITLYLGNEKEPLNVEACTSRLSLSYLISTNKISEIYKFDLD